MYNLRLGRAEAFWSFVAFCVEASLEDFITCCSCLAADNANNTINCTLHMEHFKVYSAHYTLYTQYIHKLLAAYYRLHTKQYIPHTSHYKVHITNWTRNAASVLVWHVITQNQVTTLPTSPQGDLYRLKRALRKESLEKRLIDVKAVCVQCN